MPAPSKLTQPDAKRRFPRTLAAAKKTNARNVAATRRGLAQASTAAAKLKKAGEKANVAGFKSRVGQLKPDDVDVAARVLKSLLDSVRKPG